MIRFKDYVNEKDMPGFRERMENIKKLIVEIIEKKYNKRDWYLERSKNNEFFLVDSSKNLRSSRIVYENILKHVKENIKDTGWIDYNTCTYGQDGFFLEGDNCNNKIYFNLVYKKYYGNFGIMLKNDYGNVVFLDHLNNRHDIKSIESLWSFNYCGECSVLREDAYSIEAVYNDNNENNLIIKYAYDSIMKIRKENEEVYSREDIDVDMQEKMKNEYNVVLNEVIKNVINVVLDGGVL